MAKSTRNEMLYAFNFNKWKQHINDCAIRAIVAAIGLDYELVCKQLGVSFKRGKGLIRDSGIDLDMIKSKFDQYFDVVVDFNESFDNASIPQDMLDLPEFRDFLRNDALYRDDDSPGTTTLETFCQEFAGQGTFLVGLVGNPKAKNLTAKSGGGHIVCARCLKGKKPFFIDTWDCHEMLVDSYMRVKTKIPLDDPRHFKWDPASHKFI